ncbi:SBBP repeat-containing protein [Luteitalea sp. TBR-22]|uniref:DUF7948 domain-containing protein n=1 Tax=Luteitalea sp. TBR-22 TaxID=2802971 RepID=UPI001EF45F8A|nr:SBBP repeat-containing protein [Luteitalea sp. TBR-22]
MSVQTRGLRPGSPPDAPADVARPLTGAARATAIEAINKAPLHFEPNAGRVQGAVDYLATGYGYRVALAGHGAQIALADRDGAGALIGMTLVGARTGASPEPLETLPGVTSVYRGNDARQWQRDLPTFRRIRYPGVWDGIDVVYYGNQQRLQYDFVVSPGADVARIAVEVTGADQVRLAPNGDLLMTVGDRTVTQDRPFTYQDIDGVRREVGSRFVLDGRRVRFAVDAYDVTRPLVIDPVVGYSTWFGGSGEEGILDMAIDGGGNLVALGFTVDQEFTTKFPTTNAIKPTRNLESDAFVVKFTSAGAVLFSTLLGGNGAELISPYAFDGGLALDGAGNIYVTGTTRSTDLPLAGTPADGDYNDDDPGATGNLDGFYIKLTSTGQLAYGTYLGGRRIDLPHGIDVDAAGNVYVVGSTDSDTSLGATGGFTVTGNPYDATYNGSGDMFLLRFNASGALTYGTYLGGTSGDALRATNVRASRVASNVVYVVGDSSSAAFPTTASRAETYDGSGAPDAVLVRLDLGQAGVNQLTYGTFLGGTGDEYFSSIALDSTDKVYVAGATSSSAATFPRAATVTGSIAPSGTDVLVAKFDTSQSGASSVVFATRINGYYTDIATDIALDSANQPWVGVDSGSFAATPNPAQDFPLVNTLQTTRSGNGGHQAVVQLNAAGNALLLSSLVGGNSGRGGPVALAITATDDVFVGATSAGGTTMLALANPIQSTYGGGDADATLQRLGAAADMSMTKVTDKPYPQFKVLAGESVTYTITLSNPTGDTARNITVTDNLPSEVVFVSCSTSIGTCGGNGNNRTVFIPSLPTGQTVTIVIATVAAPQVREGMVWTNTATFQTDTVDPNPGNNTGNEPGGGTPTTSTDPEGDADNDGLVNEFEDAFGLNSVKDSGDDGASGDPDHDGKTNLQEQADLTHPRGTDVVYLAEGANNSTFDTELALANPTDTNALVLSSYQKGDGTEVKTYQQIAPLTRATLNLKNIQGLGTAEFSTLVEADTGLVADRTMVWGPGGYGSHAERGIVTRNQTKWYFAEGATFGPFNLFYLIQNPTTTDAVVKVTYLLPAPAAPLVKTYPVARQSRFNIWVDNEGVVDPALAALASTDVSAIVESTNGVPIIAERAMYLDQPGQAFGAGHESAGVNAPATTWFLAEGATGEYFDLFILLANPNPTKAVVEVDYLLTTGQVITRAYEVAGNSRSNIWVDQEPGLANVALSSRVRSTNGVPIVVERSMWWPGPTSATWHEAHNSFGETSTGTRWAFAAGEVGGERQTETYVLIANTSAFPARVRATVMFDDGTAPITREDFVFAPTSRDSIVPSVHFPATVGKKFGMLIQSIPAAGQSSPAQIVVERAMYSDANGVHWAAGTNALATRLQ